MLGLCMYLVVHHPLFRFRGTGVITLEQTKRIRRIEGSVGVAGCSSEHIGQFGEIRHDEVGLMRCLAERPLAPVNESCAHTI